MTTRALQLFEEHRQLLFSIAYRMLGTVSDAQDMVQDTFIRWQQQNVDEIDSPRAWLTTALTRLCINHLKSARVQRETYVGAWLPEPLLEDPEFKAQDNTRLADSLSLAFLVLLETLSPTERAVFLLREVFDCDFSEIATMVERTEVNCRQLLARARKHVEERKPRFDASPEQADALLHQFEQSVRNGDVHTLLELLGKDVVLVSDGGGKARAVLRPLHGARPIAHLFIQAAKKFSTSSEVWMPMAVNGLPGLVGFDGEHAQRVMAFGIREGRISSIFIVTNPEKISHLTRPKAK